MDIIYRGQRPVPQPNVSTNQEDGCENEESSNDQNANTEEQENYKRDFFAMLEDVIELSSDYPRVLIDQLDHN